MRMFNTHEALDGLGEIPMWECGGEKDPQGKRPWWTLFSYKAGRGNALKDTLPSVSFLLFE